MGDVADIDNDVYNNTNEDSPKLRKIMCRYGRGCTHIYDPVHREKFWHAKSIKLSDEQLRTHYICLECGFSSPILQDLQIHLKRKTAWSNFSLIGCRISCLIDHREWHEGFVTGFHKSGKHNIEFRQIGEKRWLSMKKTAFYIIERSRSDLVMSNSNYSQLSNEFKETDTNIENIESGYKEEEWVFCEDISIDFTFAQSVLFKIYGSVVQETGHKTKGHTCLTDEDRNSSSVKNNGSLLYGELLPRGANKAFSKQRLDLSTASTLFDLGCGTGKICFQAFLQYRNLHYVYGVELSVGRYIIAEETALKMVQLLGAESFHVEINPGKSITIKEYYFDDDEIKENNDISSTTNSKRTGRTLHFECGSLFDIENISIADIIMLETDIPNELHKELCELLSNMHLGAKMLSYLDLKKIWCGAVNLCFKQVDINKPLSDRYPTSWSVQRGHHFFLWNVVDPLTIVNSRNNSSDESSENERNSSRKRVDNNRNNPNLNRNNNSIDKCMPSINFSYFSSLFKQNGKNSNNCKSSNTNDREVCDKVIPVNNDGSRSKKQNIIENNEINENQINNNDTDSNIPIKKNRRNLSGISHTKSSDKSSIKSPPKDKNDDNNEINSNELNDEFKSNRKRINNNLILPSNEFSQNTSPLRFNIDENVDDINTSTMNTPLDIKSPRSYKQGSKNKDNSEMPSPLSFSLKSSSFSEDTNNYVNNLNNEVNYIPNSSSQSMSLINDDSTESLILPSLKQNIDSVGKDNGEGNIDTNKLCSNVIEQIFNSGSTINSNTINNNSMNNDAKINDGTNNCNNIEDSHSNSVNMNEKEIVNSIYSENLKESIRENISKNDISNSSCLIM